MRAVVDTNVFVAALLRATSKPRRCIDIVSERGSLLFSEATWRELDEVLHRPWLARAIPSSTRSEFIAAVSGTLEWVLPGASIAASRDPKDDRFLEVAINGRADCIITGDRDLLVLHPFRDIPILTPAQFASHLLSR